MISASIVLDSISSNGKRLTTFRLRYPKFIHGEFMTHRVLSRNASSSRAIPTAKLIEEVRNDDLRAAPIFWGANQKGMQAAEELSEVDEVHSIHPDGYSFWKSEKEMAQFWWQEAARHAADTAETLSKLGAHKQIVNRILEPFSHINVVATATEWDNFFGLRLHKAAQPEMRELARLMWEARRASEPEELHPGEWHLPFVERPDLLACKKMVELVAGDDWSAKPSEIRMATVELALKVSTARCARVSFQSFETGKRSTIDEDLATYEKLNLPGTENHNPLEPIHASPAEHQGTPDVLESPRSMTARWLHPEQHGNLVGWRQYRKMLPGENCAPLPEEYR